MDPMLFDVTNLGSDCFTKNQDLNERYKDFIKIVEVAPRYKPKNYFLISQQPDNHQARKIIFLAGLKTFRNKIVGFGDVANY